MLRTTDGLLRPRNWAALVLASGELLPRQRARDQQADLAGNELNRRVLVRIMELDPDPADLAVVLDRIIRELGGPAGPTRAIARSVIEEFSVTCRTPELVAWLLAQAAAQSETPVERPHGGNRR